MPAIRFSGGSGPLLRSSNRSSTADGWGPTARRRGGPPVITSEPTPGGHPAASAPGSGGRGTSPDAPVTTLRGAGVDVDPRRARLLVIGASVVVLLAVAAILLVAGLNKNSQASSLHEHGVPVTVTVTGCQGLLGGSGSNAAGYSCRGTYTFGGRHFEGAIPGTALFHSGSSVRGVIVPSDPGLLSTPGELADQRASWRVFIAPVILLVVALAALAVLVRTGRRTRTHQSPGRQ